MGSTQSYQSSQEGEATWERTKNAFKERMTLGWNLKDLNDILREKKSLLKRMTILWFYINSLIHVWFAFIFMF